MNHLAFLMVLGISLLISSCSLAPVEPVPTDQYYRLPEPADLTVRRVFDESVFVRSFHSDGLHLERALIFSEDEQALVLEQHHYHFWHDSPQRMLQNYMVDWLRAVGAAPLVVTKPSIEHGFVISSYIKRFERHLSGNRVDVLVTLEMQLKQRSSRELLLVKDYTARIRAVDKKVARSVPAFAEGLDSIFAQFLGDAALSLER